MLNLCFTGANFCASVCSFCDAPVVALFAGAKLCAFICGLPDAPAVAILC